MDSPSPRIPVPEIPPETLPDVVSPLKPSTSPTAALLPGSPMPRHWRVAEDLRSRVRAGQWAPGAMLPSRQSLAREYGVALSTLERAVDTLLAERLLRAEAGRGTFVALPAEGKPFLEAEPRQAVSQENFPLGIVATIFNDFRTRTIIESLENAYGEATLCFDRAVGEGSLILMREAVAAVVDQGARALALVCYNDSPALIDELLRVASVPERIPLVVISSAALRRPVPHVFYDNRYAGYQAVKLMTDAGHRVVFFVAGQSEAWAPERLTGAQDAIRDAGLSPEALVLLPHGSLGGNGSPSSMSLDGGAWSQHPFEAGRQAAAEVFGRGGSEEAASGLGGSNRPALVTVSDSTGHGVLSAARERGLKPGIDFFVVGIGDASQSRTLGLTSFRPPLEAMGQEAARLIQAARHGNLATVEVCLRPRLVPRLSTRDLTQQKNALLFK